MAKQIPSEIIPILRRAFPLLNLCTSSVTQGQNNFCFNFRLEDTSGKQYLIKAIRLRTTPVNDPNTVLEEIKAASAIRSQYSVTLIDTKIDSGYALLLFPFIEGSNLAEYLISNSGQLSEESIKDIGISLLRGIADLSRFGIRHQDIKPENILITSDGGLKILDYGSSRFKKPSYRGSTNTNRLYSAPEQILASKPSNLEGLRLTCDERSDVYSAGAILYQLATGHPPYSSNEEKLKGGPPSLIDRADISEGVKRIIYRLLNYHTRYRPQATLAVSFFEKGDVVQPIVTRGGFFYNASTSLKRMEEAQRQDNNLFDGVIIDASKYPSSDQDYLHIGAISVIVDPQTYLFQAPKLINKKFKKLPYYELAKSGENVGIEYITETDNFINTVLDYELTSGADLLVPPFFLIKEFNDLSWTFDAEITSRSLEICQNRGLQLPILKGVAVAENVLLSDTTRGRLIDHLTTTDWLPETAGYFVLLECSQHDGYPNEAWLKASKEIITGLLSTGKIVIWSHAYLASIVFAHSGIGLGMGEGIAQRSFSLSEDIPTVKKTTPHLYLPNLFARMKWPTGIRAFLSHRHPRLSDLICTDLCCSGVDFTNPTTRGGKDLALHTIRQLALQYKKYSSSGGAIKSKADLIAAKTIYEEFRSNRNDLFRIAIKNELKPNSGSYLEGWLNAFHSG